jgi:hypothetical protein
VSVTLREEREFGVFEKGVVRIIFGHKGREVTGRWRELHNEELHNFSTPDTPTVVDSRRMRWAGHVAQMT